MNATIRRKLLRVEIATAISDPGSYVKRLDIDQPDPITGREHPDTLRCICLSRTTYTKYHSYNCPVHNWLSLNPPPRTPCPTCNGRGSINQTPKGITTP